MAKENKIIQNLIEYTPGAREYKVFRDNWVEMAF